jgi:hypothetical protein
VKFRNPFVPKTVKSILSDVYDAIDELEILSEQRQFQADHIEKQIAELRVEKTAALNELSQAEHAASKLRSLVEV